MCSVHGKYGSSTFVDEKSGANCILDCAKKVKAELSAALTAAGEPGVTDGEPAVVKANIQGNANPSLWPTQLFCRLPSLWSTQLFCRLPSLWPAQFMPRFLLVVFQAQKMSIFKICSTPRQLLDASIEKDLERLSVLQRYLYLLIELVKS